MTRHLAAGLALLAMLAMGACSKSDENVLQGWIEADFIFVSPDEQGRIVDMKVREGDSVEKGALLFTLDSDLQQADFGVAEAAYTGAKQNFERAQNLLKVAAGTQKAYDDAMASYRDSEARLNAAKTRLDRRRAFSPVSGNVHQIYYRPGETVPASKPVIAMLPPGNIKVRFFVPETMLPRIALGDRIEVSCDGCSAPIEARVSFISRNAEFTPPVIYSIDERNKLVYLVEARAEKVDSLRVGQPVDVRVHPRETGK
jgi:HlyD family secretion protein